VSRALRIINGKTRKRMEVEGSIVETIDKRGLYSTDICKGSGKADKQKKIIGCRQEGGRKVDQREDGRTVSSSYRT
jgi:hypothetical protein